MRQIGDQLRVDPREPVDLSKAADAIQDRTELSQEETEDITRYGKITFKLMMNKVCNESCFSKSDNDYASCFNACNVKMYSIKKMYSGVSKSFTQRMQAHDQANSNPWI
jgi:hypothetical protein